MATLPWVGNTSESSAWVRGRIDGSSARLKVSLSSGLSSGEYFGPEAPTSDGIVSIRATSLTPDRRYYFLLEVDGVDDHETVGTFRTHPVLGEPSDVTVAVFSCAGSTPEYPGVGGVRIPNRISNHPGHLTILDRDPLMLVHQGDIAYYDPSSGNHGVTAAEGATPEFLREMFDDVFTQPNQAQLYRSVGTAYVQDDHDGGPNDHDGSAASYPAFWQVYRERVPHYDLPVPDCNFQAWQIARTQFVLWDVRSRRSPNTAPDGPDKTMLGAGQRHAFEQILATSTAEALVICNPDDWISNSRTDSWASFATERQWIADRLAEYGWTGRVVMVGGDLHLLGLDTGANTVGGMPLLQAASIDSTPSGSTAPYDLGGVAGRHQYGTVRINDTGNQIAITLTGWQGGSAWRSHTHVITLDTPPPPPPPTPETVPPPVAVGAIRDTVRWMGVDDRTGRVIADLPDITGTTSRLLMAYTSSKLELPLTESGPGGLPIRLIEQATQPQGCSIVQVVNDLPVWAGRVLIRVGGSGENMNLAVATSEQYLLGRQVTARTFANLDLALAGADLLTDAGSTDLGPGMALEIDADLTGDTTDREYHPADLLNVYRGLRELSGAATLEWTIDLDWTDHTATVLRRIARLRRRIGRTGGKPPIFETEGDVFYDLIEDFSSGRYANVVTVYGDGEGDDLPRSDPQVDTAALAGGVPIVEHAIHARDVSDPNVLNTIAKAELARRMHGAQLWELDCPLHADPRLGLAAGLGDTGRWKLTGPRHPSPDGVQPGVEGEGRIIGWSADAEKGRWGPQLLDPHEDTAL